MLEAVRTASDGGDDHGRADDADAVDEPRPFDHVLELRPLRQADDLLVVGLDLQVDRLEDADEGPGGIVEIAGPRRTVEFVEPLGRAVLDSLTHRLREAADLVDDLRPLGDQHVAGRVIAEHLLIDLVLEEHRVEHRGIGDGQPRELAGVVTVVLRVRPGDRRHLAGVGDDRPVAERPEAPVHPPAVRPGLEHNRPVPVKLRERLVESFLRRGAGRLDDHAPFASGQLRHHADFRSLVAHVDANCGIIFHCSPSLGYVVLVLHLLTDECVIYVKSIITDLWRDCVLSLTWRLVNR